MIDGVKSAFRAGHKSVLLQAPTGCGKTVIAASMIMACAKKGGAVWFINHRAELIYQSSNTMKKFDIDHGVVASSYEREYNKKVQIISVGSLSRRLADLISAIKSQALKAGWPSLIIWDEAHHIAAGGWAKIHEQLSMSYHVLLTATPERLDGTGLEKFASFMVQGPTTEWLIEQKYLSDYDLIIPVQPSIEGLTVSGSDYNKKQNSDLMGKPTITGDIVANYKKYAMNKRGIIFEASIENSERRATAFREAGINALHLDGKTDKTIRRAACQAYARGEIQVLCNVDLFGEGFDIAAQAGIDVTIEAAVMARPTKSLALYSQQVGRALRPKKENAIILDHAGNYQQHGLPCAERQWSLKGKKERKRLEDEEEETPIYVKRCPFCFKPNRSQLKVCASCNTEFPLNPRYIKQVEGELEKINKEKLKREKKREQGSCRTFEDLLQLGIDRGYSSPEAWAGKIWTSRQAAERNINARMRRTA